MRGIILPLGEEELSQIKAIIRADDSFVSYVDGDIYDLSPVTSPLNAQPKATAMLDRNYYTRLVALAEGKVPREYEIADFQKVAATHAYCQLVNIRYDYLSSLAEYESFKGTEAAASQLKALHIADNVRPDHWVWIALGKSSHIPDKAIAEAEKSKQRSPADSEGRKADFTLNYVMVLKALSIAAEPGRDAEKMMRFIDWMVDDFLLGAPGILFGAIFFSPKRPGKFVKDRTRAATTNATWDLSLIQEWQRRMKREANAPTKYPIVLITRDKGVKLIARGLHAPDQETFNQYILNFWPDKKGSGNKILEHYLRRAAEVEAMGDARGIVSPETVKEMTQTLEGALGFLD